MANHRGTGRLAVPAVRRLPQPLSACDTRAGRWTDSCCPSIINEQDSPATLPTSPSEAVLMSLPPANDSTSDSQASFGPTMSPGNAAPRPEQEGGGSRGRLGQGGQVPGPHPEEPRQGPPRQLPLL